MKVSPKANPNAMARWATTAKGVAYVRIFGYFKFNFNVESAMYIFQVSLVY